MRTAVLVDQVEAHEGGGQVGCQSSSRLRMREPGHRMLRTPERDVHLHVWRSGSEDERRHLAFRDRLRTNAEDRARYERAKHELAGQWRDMNYYARAKSSVIEAILARACTEVDNPDEV